MQQPIEPYVTKQFPSAPKTTLDDVGEDIKKWLVNNVPGYELQQTIVIPKKIDLATGKIESVVFVIARWPQ